MRIEVAAALMDIEAQLRQMRLWDDEAPDAELLASTQPFAVDTLTLPQWLQWIFLPTMYRLIDDKEPLPSRCGITPMAEEYFRGQSLPVQGLLDALEAVDRLLCGKATDYSLHTQPDSEAD